RHVVVVDAEKDHALPAILLPRRLQHLRLLLARPAPRGEEVEHDRLAAERPEVDRAGARQSVEREVRRRPPELRRMRLMRQLPHEQREQPGDGGERDALRGELEGTHQAATMYTGVPTFTWLKSHSACGMCMRMQPCERE